MPSIKNLFMPVNKSYLHDNKICFIRDRDTYLMYLNLFVVNMNYHTTSLRICARYTRTNTDEIKQLATAHSNDK